MHEQQYIGRAWRGGQRERCVLPGRREPGRSEHRRSAAPCASPPRPARASRLARGVRGHLHACTLLTSGCWAALADPGGHFCRRLKHGMQPVHSPEARRAVQVTVRSLSGKE